MKSNVRWKRRLGKLGRPFRVRQAASRRVVLIYHAVGNGPNSLERDQFIQQVDWLAANTEVVSLERILECRESARMQVAITFDDGYRSVYAIAAPTLEKYGLPATVYLTSGAIGNENRISSSESLGHYPGEEFMLWEEAARLSEMGWTIGSHGVDHVDLTLLAEEDIAHQTDNSRIMIEARLNEPCRHFAYTWGKYNETVIKMLKGKGYNYAAAAHHACVTPGFDPFAIPRLDVRREYSLEDFVAVVQGDWDYLCTWQKIKGHWDTFNSGRG